jgi:rubrerythrin
MSHQDDLHDMAADSEHDRRKEERMEQRIEVLWKCPICGYVLTDIQMQSFTFDVGCPRCRTDLVDFHIERSNTNE